YAEQQVIALKLIPPNAAGELPIIAAESLQIEKREPLLAEIESFITAVGSRTPPEVSGADGRRALALAIKVLDQIKAHSERAGIGLNFD
ncbi:MAG TPA: gfo/Idh/MocA family oxidoreductase, partial [Blastocatellia bacterium]